MKEVVREDFHGCFGIFTYLVGVHTGLPIGVAATAALLQLPYFAALSMPMACLAASLFGLGRLQVILWYRFCCPYCYLSTFGIFIPYWQFIGFNGTLHLQADMETVAIFSAGVSLWRMLVSPLCLGFVAVLLKLVCHECLIPYGSSEYETHHCLLFMLLYEPLWFFAQKHTSHKLSNCTFNLLIIRHILQNGTDCERCVIELIDNFHGMGSHCRARRMVDMALTTHIQGLRQNNDLVYPEYGVKV